MPFTGLPLQGLFLFAFAYRLARKRVCLFLQRQLVRCQVFLQLPPYILDYSFRIFTHRIHILPPTPRVPVAVLILQVGMPVEYHQ